MTDTDATRLVFCRKGIMLVYVNQRKTKMNREGRRMWRFGR